jgi:hypothetical protein
VTLLRGIEAVELQQEAVRRLLAHEPAQEALDFLGRPQAERGGGAPHAELGIAGVSHEDADTARGERCEGVLVGHVVAQVERDHVVAVEPEHAQQGEHRLALVPVDPGLELVDQLAGGDLQLARMVGEQGVDDLSDPRPLAVHDQAVVERDRAVLALDDDALDRADLLVRGP